MCFVSTLLVLLNQLHLRNWHFHISCPAAVLLTLFLAGAAQACSRPEQPQQHCSLAGRCTAAADGVPQAILGRPSTDLADLADLAQT
jgi:hypothetical protein